MECFPVYILQMLQYDSLYEITAHTTTDAN